MMRTWVTFVATVTLCVATSAFSAERTPGWVNGTAEFFPNELYIVGVGSGDERADAETRARAAVSAVFSVRISAQTTISASQSEIVDGARSKLSSTNSVIQDATAATDRVLEGVTIAESWEDPETKRVYALAVLNRKKAALILREKLKNLDGAAKPQVALLTSVTEPMHRAGAGFRLQALAVNHDALIADLRVIQPGVDAACETDWEAARRSADTAVRALQVSVKVAGSANARAIETGAIKALAALGIHTVEGSAQPDIAVTVNLDANLTGPKEGWYYARLTATAAAKEVRTGTQMTQFDASVRQAASDPNEAGRRAADALAKKVAEGLQPALRGFFVAQ